MSRQNNCMFALPHELTGIGTTCGLFGGQLACNGYGRGCTGYHVHTAESRKALAKAIEKKRAAARSRSSKDEMGIETACANEREVEK